MTTISISFKRLLEIEQGSKMTTDEESILMTKKSVYAIYNKNINKIYIGETVDTYIRLFSFWKKDKRHVTGINSPIIKYFDGDFENTYFKVLEFNCDNQEREFFWDNYYRNNTSYIIVSHPGRHGCTNPGNKGLIAINKGSQQTYINSDDFEIFSNLGWSLGGKKQELRTEEQKRVISESHKGQVPWNKGIKLSDEQKKSYKKLGRKKGTTNILPIEKKIKYDKIINLIKEGNLSLRSIAKSEKVGLTTVRRIKEKFINKLND